MCKKRLLYIFGIMSFVLILASISYFYVLEPRYFKYEVSKTQYLDSDTEGYIEVSVKNNSSLSVSSEKGYFLSYHIVDEADNIIQQENVRTIIELLDSGEKRIIAMKIDPLPVGEYFIEIDIVKENEFWFKDKYNKTAKCNLLVGE